MAVILGGVELSAAFSALPFDHLMFTGSPGVGKLVQKAAAENLTPVTLELGGKNPVVVGHDAVLSDAAVRVAGSRLANGGQFCLGGSATGNGGLPPSPSGADRRTRQPLTAPTATGRSQVGGSRRRRAPHISALSWRSPDSPTRPRAFTVRVAA
ncbi:aldehyde dehydrogenase family protein [Streptomyces sp. NPDC059582]|uniref:aldehyde dehydrogenase family protein n=1 Tax=Streptomyces sp. NPDC059582 TaxID=3346875 RepID=UPI0036781D90